MELNIEELRADVREALEAGRPNVTLIYGDDANYEAAMTAMRREGYALARTKHHRGGIIIVRLANKPVVERNGLALPTDPQPPAAA